MISAPEGSRYQTFEAETEPAFLSPLLTPRRIVRRRPTPQQGRALEILGHAIEYLIDSEIRFSDAVPSKPVGDATRILMARSREVYAECAEIVPVGQRIKLALVNMFGRPPLQSPLRPGPQL